MMKVAVDTSALVRLAWREAKTDQLIEAFRGLGRPPLVVSDMVLLEAETAIRAKAFQEKSGLGRGMHAAVNRTMKAALKRLQDMRERGLILKADTDWVEWMRYSRLLTKKWAESHGARTMDILHVAFALSTRCDSLFTCDERQALVAQGEGLEVVTVKG